MPHIEYKKVYWLLIMGHHWVPAYLFKSKEERSEYIEDYMGDESYRVFEYEVDKKSLNNDIREGCPY